MQGAESLEVMVLEELRADGGIARNLGARIAIDFGSGEPLMILRAIAVAAVEARFDSLFERRELAGAICTVTHAVTIGFADHQRAIM